MLILLTFSFSHARYCDRLGTKKKDFEICSHKFDRMDFCSHNFFQLGKPQAYFKTDIGLISPKFF